MNAWLLPYWLSLLLNLPDLRLRDADIWGDVTCQTRPLVGAQTICDIGIFHIIPGIVWGAQIVRKRGGYDAIR